MSASPSRGNLFVSTITDSEAWASPSPQQEARSCLQIARSNGGVQHMRSLIGINDAERAELLNWAAEEPGLTGRIISAITYRETVLREFDRLLETHKRTDTRDSNTENGHEN